MRLLLTILLSALASLLIAQRTPMYQGEVIENIQNRFIRLNSDNGLSHDVVSDILQDKNGYIWISTLGGLNCYDGTKFEIFLNKASDSNSLSSNYVTSLEELPNGTLFIGTEKGLNQYHNESNSFSLVDLSFENFGKKDIHIRQLLAENDCTLWIETLSGWLLKYNPLSNQIEKSYRHSRTTQPYYLYHDIYRDKTGTLWLGTRNTNALYINAETDKVKEIPFSEQDFTKKRTNDIACFYEDSYGNFWVTALDGVYLFDKKTENFTLFLPISTTDVKEDQQGDIWFATGNGIYKYSVKDSTMQRMGNIKDNPYSISSNGVLSIMEDRMGNLWFATDNGVNIYSPPAFPFQHYTHIPGISNSPEGYQVDAVAEDQYSNLWIGYKEDGLDYFNRKQNTFTHFLSDKTKKNKLNNNSVSALYYDKNSLLWIGLWSGTGFNTLDPTTGTFSHYAYDKTSRSVDWYSDFIEDKNDNLYIGFWGGSGLVPFDRTNHTFLPSLQERFERVYCSRIITKMTLDTAGSIWFGTTGCGLHRYFPESDSGVSYFSDAARSHGLWSNTIPDICTDSEGGVWLINEKLQKYIPEKDSFLIYGASQGLTTGELASIVADNSGNLWIGSKNRGLFKFNTTTEQFTNYVKQDGLQSNRFTKARLKLKSGALFFGNTNGFNIFNPEQIKNDTELPTPYFGRFYIYDNVIFHDPNLLKKITLKPEDKAFTVELISSDVVNPERYSYSCLLEGYDNDWITINNTQRMVRYAAIPTGTYTLKYRVGNGKGHWSEKQAEITIEIEKEFYLEWWFIASALFAFALILYILIKKRELDLKNRQKTMILQQRLFRLQMNPHFIYNSLSVIQSYIYTSTKEKAINYLSGFAMLMRGILDASREEFITFEKEIKILENYFTMQQLRYSHTFEYQLIIDPKIDIKSIEIPPMLSQPFIENAIEHGIKNMQGGKIAITYTLKKDCIECKVADNGVGYHPKPNEEKKNHQPHAIVITSERLNLLSKKAQIKYNLEIINKADESPEKRGTVVRFNLPFKELF